MDIVIFLFMLFGLPLLAVAFAIGAAVMGAFKHSSARLLKRLALAMGLAGALSWAFQSQLAQISFPSGHL